MFQDPECVGNAMKVYSVYPITLFQLLEHRHWIRGAWLWGLSLVVSFGSGHRLRHSMASGL